MDEKPFRPALPTEPPPRVVHMLAGLPPERFQGPLLLLRPLMPDPEPPPTFDDCPLDPLTGAPLMSEPEPIDDSLTTWLGPDATLSAPPVGEPAPRHLDPSDNHPADAHG